MEGRGVGEKSTVFILRLIITIKVFVKRKMLSIETILSTHTHARARAHTHTHTHTHTRPRARARTHTHTRTHEHSDYSKLNLHQLKTGSKHRLQTDEDSSMEQKTWQYRVWGKELFLGYI